jgi:two-component system, NtrC family, response regulator AlgB
MAIKVAASDATVLLRGESGTGKGVLARMIHARSGRAAGPFVTVHCPSLSAGLLQSELFGHVRGSFTGAVHDTVGKVTAANGGTLFLDEIGELPSALQPQLLRLLAENRYERMGDSQPQECDIRLLAATNCDLAAAVAGGTFRDDLLYRLNVIEIVLPPLRERRADIPVLANHLLQFFARRSAKPVFGFAPEALSAIQSHRWPGNVRELRNAIERAVILAAGSMVGVADLPSQVRTALPGALV